MTSVFLGAQLQIQSFSSCKKTFFGNIKFKMNNKLKSVQFITVTFIIIYLIYPYFPGKERMS
jgi:hypothetical protein